MAFMAKRSQMERLLPVLACWLTALASGDDVNLLRLLLPSFFSAGVVVPLDDPNADFYACCDSASCSAETRTQADDSPLSAFPAAPLGALADSPCPLPLQLPGAVRSSRNSIGSPLLC
jgi:hypothetical protein